MTIGKLIFVWFVLALLGVGIVGGILTSYLPESNQAFANQVADGGILAALYAGLFVLILGMGMCLAYYRHWRHDGIVSTTHHWPALRQTTLVAIGVTALVALQGFGVLSWLDGILLAISLILVELSFRVKTT